MLHICAGLDNMLYHWKKDIIRSHAGPAGWEVYPARPAHTEHRCKCVPLIIIPVSVWPSPWNNTNTELPSPLPGAAPHQAGPVCHKQRDIASIPHRLSSWRLKYITFMMHWKVISLYRLLPEFWQMSLTKKRISVTKLLQNPGWVKISLVIKQNFF